MKLTTRLIHFLDPHGRWRGYVRPEEFGAVGDGVTDDGPALSRATSASARTIRFRRRTYLIEHNLKPQKRDTQS